MFYFLQVIIVLYNLFLYAIFRGGIYQYLRLSKMSKTNIRKNQKDFADYWLYRSIHRQHPMGILYGLNLVFLMATISCSAIILVAGFIKVLQPFVWGISLILCLIEIPAVAIASFYDCKAEFGPSFVLLRKRKESNGYYSSLLDMLPWCVTAILVCFSYGLL